MATKLLQAPATERSWEYNRNERLETHAIREYEASPVGRLSAEERAILGDTVADFFEKIDTNPRLADVSERALRLIHF